MTQAQTIANNHVLYMLLLQSGHTDKAAAYVELIENGLAAKAKREEEERPARLLQAEHERKVWDRLHSLRAAKKANERKRQEEFSRLMREKYESECPTCNGRGHEVLNKIGYSLEEFTDLLCKDCDSTGRKDKTGGTYFEKQKAFNAYMREKYPESVSMYQD